MNNEVLIDGVYFYFGIVGSYPSEVFERAMNRVMNLQGELDQLRSRAAEADALRSELDKWRAWKPDDEDLAELQEQAMQRNGDHKGSLSACVVYIGALEARLRERDAETDALRAERDAQAKTIEAARKVMSDVFLFDSFDAFPAMRAWLAANAPTQGETKTSPITS